MECIEAAFIRKETAMKTNQLSGVFVDDLWPVADVPNGSSCDDFVDEFLNFSDQEDHERQLLEAEHETNHEDDDDDKNSNDLSTNSHSSSSTSSSCDAEFCFVPEDDELVSLEWLSNFVDDSNSEYSTPLPVGVLAEKPEEESQNRSEQEKAPRCFKFLAPGKARSKRRRTGIWVSPLCSATPIALTESCSGSTTSSSSSSYCHWLTNHSDSGLVYLEPVSYEKPRVKGQWRKTACNPDSSVMQQPRRCSHCGVTKTPQWRAGPLGAKTLCNACGVRYKSGRLFPEYRPACSPTFSSDLHSNNHRKVLEMRKQKEDSGGQTPIRFGSSSCA